MKKIILVFIFSLFFTLNTKAFDYTCFQNFWKITWVENKTIKVITDNLNNYYFQDDKLLNTKILSSNEKRFFEFLVNGKKYNRYSTSFDQYDEDKFIIIKFDNELFKNTFNYEFSTNNYNYHYEISNDWKKWFQIADNIRDYDISYLKIVFDNEKLKNTYIYELSFFQNWDNELLVNSLSNKDIFVYNWYLCSDDELTNLIKKTKKTEYFPVDINTKTFELNMSFNPNYNVNHIIQYVNKDTDNDGVIDSNDNCIYVYNPDQLDSNVSWVWDVCSDKDNDWILWNIDNCPLVKNPNQKDDNKNWVWDTCELDEDKDWVFNSLDNCKDIYNPDQFDIDLDWVWDTCDNCLEKYNADQKDIDKDNIWDICDEKDDRYIESNKNFFIWILICIVLLFSIWIYIMISKIKNIKQ